MPMESAWQTEDQSDLFLTWFACSSVCVCARGHSCSWLEPVLSKARTWESPGTAPVLIGCNFWVEPEDTCVKTWKFPSPVREAEVHLALCTLSFWSAVCVCRCLSGMCLYGLVLWCQAVVAGTCSRMLSIFHLFCFFLLKIPTFILFWFYSAQYCDLEST